MNEPKKYVLICKKPKKYSAWILAALGIPLCVFATAMVIDYYTTEVTVTDSAMLRTNMPATMSVPAGGSYTYAYNVSNNANTQQNYTLSLQVTPWENNLAKLVIDDVSGLEGYVQKTFEMSPNSIRSGSIRFQFNSTAMGNYRLNLSVTQGNFSWVI
jgi:hypothetical protein